MAASILVGSVRRDKVYAERQHDVEHVLAPAPAGLLTVLVGVVDDQRRVVAAA